VSPRFRSRSTAASGTPPVGMRQGRAAALHRAGQGSKKGNFYADLTRASASPEVATSAVLYSDGQAARGGVCRDPDELVSEPQRDDQGQRGGRGSTEGRVKRFGRTRVVLL